MAMSEQLQIINELRNGPGPTVEERTDAVLSKRGWDKQLAKLDEDFRAIVRRGLMLLASRHSRPEDPRDIERQRHKREMEKAAASGMYGDFYADQYAGLDAASLASKLPCEKYWVESLGRHVPRDELAFQLEAVAELRKITHARLQEIEASANPYRHELAIFNELLRGTAAYYDVPTASAAAHYPQ